MDLFFKLFFPDHRILKFLKVKCNPTNKKVLPNFAGNFYSIIIMLNLFYLLDYISCRSEKLEFVKKKKSLETNWQEMSIRVKLLHHRKNTIC